MRSPQLTGGSARVLITTDILTFWPTFSNLLQAEGHAVEFVADWVILLERLHQGTYQGCVFRQPDTLEINHWLSQIIESCSRHGVGVIVVLASATVWGEVQIGLPPWLDMMSQEGLPQEGLGRLRRLLPLGQLGEIAALQAQLAQAQHRQQVLESALKGSETKFLKFFQRNPNPMTITTLDTGRYVEVNEAFVSTTGYQRDEVVGKSVVDVDLWVNLRYYSQILRIIDHRGKLQNYESKFKTRDGQVRTALVSAETIELFGQLCLLWVGNDITERKQAEAALRQSEERWQLVIAANDDGIWDMDYRSGTVFRSDRWHTMLGYEPNELPPTNEAWVALVHTEDCDRILSADRAYLAQQTPQFAEEYRLRCKDGHYKWVFSRAQAVWDAQGRPLRMVGSITDISDRKQREEVFRLIVEGTATETGEAFFYACVRYLAQMLGVRYAFVSKSVEPSHERVRTLAFWADDSWGANFEYALADTPCNQVFQGENCYIFDQVQQRFPSDRFLHDHDIRSYLGVPMIDGANRVIGHIGVMDTKAMQPDPSRGLILRIFAARAGAELERTLAEQQIKVQSRAEHLISQISRAFVEHSSTVAIQFALQAIGEFTGADRSYSYIYDAENDRWQLIYEWCDRTLQPLPEQHHILEAHQVPWLHKELLHGQFMIVPSITHLPDSAISEQTCIDALAINSLVNVPITHGGQSAGFVGICTHSIEQPWNYHTAQLLQVVGELIFVGEAHRKAKIALVSSETQYRYLVQTANCIILRWDVDGHIRFINDYGQTFFGYSSSELEGQHLIGTLIPSLETTGRDLRQLIQAIGSTPENYLLNENEAHRQDGERVWIAWANCPIKNEADELTEILSVGTDITQRKQAEDALRQAKQEAEVANRVKSEFLANMSHELRTPLNAILGFTQLLLRESDLNDLHRSHLSVILNSGEHLLTLINEVLDMAKIEAGRITFNPNCFDLHALLSSLVAMFGLRAATKGVTLSIQQSPLLPQYVYTDEGKLRQVLINLLGNAVKFTPRGSITLQAEPASTVPFSDTPPLWPALLNHEPTRALIFAVTDTGPGIPETMHSIIFEPFVQSTSDANSTTGSGLGLPISHQFVHLMGGHLTLQSQVGQGSCFAFTIPVKPVERSDLLPSPTQLRVLRLADNQPSYRILVVEDRWENRQFLVKLLEHVGFEVREAEDGQQAIDLWQQWEPHLIWMDMRMPRMDGYAATRQIKAHLRGQATVIIALTASVLESERAVILSTGCDDFVRKPFQETIIFEKLAQYLGVKYEYAMQPMAPGAIPQTQHSGGLPLEAFLSGLAQKPQSWLRDLGQAATQADQEWLKVLLAEIHLSHPQVAQQMLHWVDEFQYDQIIDLVEKILHPLNPVSIQS